MDKTPNSIRVRKAFDNAFTVLREETESVADALGFIRPGVSLSEVIAIEVRRAEGGWKQKKFARLPDTMRARVRCAEIIEGLEHVHERPGGKQRWGGFKNQIAMACCQIDELLLRQLPIALGRTVAPRGENPEAATQDADAQGGR
jgi:hypothetical protein